MKDLSERMAIFPLDEPGEIPDGWVPVDNRMASIIRAAAAAAPGMIGAAELAGAYRVVFPKGITGVMPMSSDGIGFLPQLRGLDGRITQNARVAPLTSPAVATAVFNLLSVAVMQHYLTEISGKLSDIQAGLDRVLDFLYIDKACELYAEAQSVGRIQRDIFRIAGSPELRTAGLVTLQHARAFAERNVYFYYRDIHRMADSGADARNARAADDIRGKMQCYRLAVDLFGVCAVLETLLSQCADADYLTAQQNDCSAMTEKYVLSVASLEGKVSAASKPQGFALPLPGQDDGARIAKALHNDILKEAALAAESRRYAEILAGIREEYEAVREYRVELDGTVYQKR